MTDPSPELVSCLPDRPLSLEEGGVLQGNESPEITVLPEGILSRNDQEIVIALVIDDRNKGILYLVGYSPATQQWSVVDHWNRVEVERRQFTERLKAWEVGTFGHRPEFRFK